MKRTAVLAAAVAGIAGLASVAGAQEIETFDSPNQTQIGNGNFAFANPIQGSWASSNGGVITDNPTNITITTNAPSNVGGYGTAYHNIYSQDNPSVIDISGSNALQLDVTINSGDAGLFVDLQDGEGDYWQYFYGYGLVGSGNAAPQEPGETITQLPDNELVLDVPLATPYNTEGSPTFDFTQLVLFRLEDDPGPSLANSISYNDLSAVTVNLPLVWNNAMGNNQWDISTSANWNNGAGNSVYTDGSNVTFNDSNPSSTPANYAVTLNTTVSPGSVTVNNSAGNYTISGTGGIGGTGSLTKMGTDTLTLSTANTYSGGTNVSAGLLLIDPTSTPATTSALPKGALTITGGEVQLADGVTLGSQSANPPVTKPTSSVNITSLSISGTGTLDIGNNHIIIDYTTGNDPIASIAAWIKSGYNSDAWTGTGITSSDAVANKAKYGIGYADAADPGNPAGLSSGQIEIRYTLLGDANLDGKVNGTDFTILATNFNQSGKSWDQGDFNYDGKVNGTDFLVLAADFNQSAGQSAVAADDLAAVDSFAGASGLSLANVPEPTSTVLCIVAGLGALARRRRTVRHCRKT